MSVLLVLGLAACHDSGDSGSVVSDPRARLGEPLPELTAAELAAFERGKLIFERRFRPSGGLGPLYNATSCRSCHSTPTTGGSSQIYRNFYLALWDDGIAQVPLPALPSAVVPAFGAGTNFGLERGRAVIPADVGGVPVTVAQRNALPIFGTGLFEFVSDAEIMGRADPDDDDGDGISGRFNTDGGTLGRFGAKAQSNNVELFTRAPLFNQMGVTSNPFLGSGGTVSLGHLVAPQVSSDPNAPTADFDGVADPEITRDDLGDLIAFSRFLAPPEPLPFDAAATRGEALFNGAGCTACHVPQLPTSRFGAARAYSDLLLHEMGPALADGIGLGVPQTSSISRADTTLEFRTQPLWGVSLSAPFLHDGSAETLRAAIELHGGEAQASHDAFVLLTPDAQDDLISFLEHL